MSQKIVIWTLNRATDLIQGHRNDIVQIFKNQGLDCEWGARENDPGTSEFPYQLMYESKDDQDVDEYFVPIPLKCIGKRAWTYQTDKTTVPESGRAILDGILAAPRYSYFTDKSLFDAFWQKGKSDPVPPALQVIDETIKEVFGRVRMKTEDAQGYYEILEQYSDAKHILIGYSQGGLVARYLAFLDEYVFQKNIIAGVITIASPNYGSPLANPKNGNTIAKGIIEIADIAQKAWVVKVARQLDKTLDTIINKLVSPHFQTDSYPQLYQLIQTQYQKRMEKPSASPAKKDRLTSLLKTAIKWLSGLQGYSFSAFDDLDIQNYDEPYSVLALVNKPDYGIKSTYMGAVLTGNNTTAGIFASLIPIRFLKPLIQRIIGVAPPLRKRIQKYDHTYKTQIMTEGEESRESSSPLVAAITTNYNQGTTVKYKEGEALAIPAQAHDFVIPTASQALPNANTLLGHRINLKANHNNGKDLKSGPGQQNWDYIEELLDLMAKAISLQSTQS